MTKRSKPGGPHLNSVVPSFPFLAINQAIAAIVDESQLSQSEFARLCNVSQPTARKWMTGPEYEQDATSVGPSMPMIFWIEECLDLPPGTIFRRAGLLPYVSTVDRIRNDLALDPEDQESVAQFFLFRVKAAQQRRRNKTKTAQSRKFKKAGNH